VKVSKQYFAMPQEAPRWRGWLGTMVVLQLVVEGCLFVLDGPQASVPL
jgi:hypothetical protein